MLPALPEGLARNGGYQAIDLDAGSILSPSAEGSGSVWGSVILGVKSVIRGLGHSAREHSLGLRAWRLAQGRSEGTREDTGEESEGTREDTGEEDSHGEEESLYTHLLGSSPFSVTPE